jgi:CheY-like chemotaxis protein
MGGAVNASSKPGAGSTFWIDIPFAVAVCAEPDTPEPAVSVDLVSWATPPLVLVAEDNPVNQKVAVRTLERCGCEIDVVNNGREALDALAARRYAVVLMDCQMPVMDGYDATTELRRRERGLRRTPVIAMTAHAMNGAAERCMAAGMDDYIPKPVRRAQLIEALRRWIGPPGELASAAGQAADPS